jgi:ribonuclease HII
MGLLSYYSENSRWEAGCDEAGRGCLAGPVYAAAVILPKDYHNELLNDSKKLSVKKRNLLREMILNDALAWSVSSVEHSVIDKINILNASILAMQQALDGLSPEPDLILVDGIHFKPYKDTEYQTIVKGDGKYLSIAAASILAKTFRDEYMQDLARKHPQYGWEKNKGYGTKSHIQAIMKYGYTGFHRKSFHLKMQLKFDF